MISLTCSFSINISGRNERYYRSNPERVKDLLANQLASGIDPTADNLSVSNIKIAEVPIAPQKNQ
ncbi:hypothetical protein [Muribaculum intestinale]|uniref:hypothetical protein n=1 Tax=Muribaculum intestinale TaxID=1796646 RepID=UPI002675C3F7|nr:hypothetical protein [Muribaculum intestinale]